MEMEIKRLIWVSYIRPWHSLFQNVCLDFKNNGKHNSIHLAKWFPPLANVLIFIFGSYNANPLNIFTMHKTWCRNKKNNNDSIPKMKLNKWQQVRLKTLKFTDLQPDVFWSRRSWKWTPSLSAYFGSLSALKSQNCTVLGLGKNKCLHLMASVGW